MRQTYDGIQSRAKELGIALHGTGKSPIAIVVAEKTARWNGNNNTFKGMNTFGDQKTRGKYPEGQLCKKYLKDQALLDAMKKLELKPKHLELPDPSSSGQAKVAKQPKKSSRKRKTGDSDQGAFSTDPFTKRPRTTASQPATSTVAPHQPTPAHLRNRYPPRYLRRLRQQGLVPTSAGQSTAWNPGTTSVPASGPTFSSASFPVQAQTPAAVAARDPPSSSRGGATGFGIWDIRSGLNAVPRSSAGGSNDTVNAEQLAEIARGSVRGSGAQKRRQLYELSDRLRALAEEDKRKYEGDDKDSGTEEDGEENDE